jgi:hypothetical protein
MFRFATALGAVMLSLAVASTSHAQLVGLKHLWSISGVQNTAGSVGTIISCTNGGTANQTIGVDVYGPAGAYVNGNSLPVAPSSTALFGTGLATDVSIDVNLAVGVLTKGSARVYGSGGGIFCTAYLVNQGNGFPLADLAIVKKFSQKGD